MNSGTKRFLRTGAPFLAFMVVSAYGLTYFAEIRYWASRYRKLFAVIDPEDPRHRDSLASKTLDEIYQEEIAGKSLDNWVNLRAPRPWEPETIKANEEKSKQLRQQRSLERLAKIEERAAAASKASKESEKAS